MSNTPPIYVDLRQTRRRIERLSRYVDRELLKGEEFRCADYQVCRKSRDREAGHVFLPGTMSHVGRRFDLLRGGQPLRVVVVGQEAADRHVGLRTRYRQVHDESGLSCRYYADTEHSARNPHMRGTTSALRLIFGKGLGADKNGEWIYPVNGKPFHIFDGFALVNRLLCFAGPPNSRQGRATATMVHNCGRHLTATLAILQPTILILQGKGVTAWTDTVLTARRVFSPNLAEGHFGSQRMLVCTFSHPSARGDLRWGDSLSAPYLTQVVQPTLLEAVQRLGR